MDENPIFSENPGLRELREAVERIRAEIGRVIVGQEEMVNLLIAAMLADGHSLIEGVPGVAKTLSARLVAKTIDAGFSRIQFTPDLMPADVLGTTIFNPRNSAFEFRKGPIFSNIILIDEINRAPAKTQSALFEVMEERQVSVDGHTYTMDYPFMVVATQNPVEHEGTYRLPEAQLDRFLFKIEVQYPTLEQETAILYQSHRREEKDPVAGVQALLGAESLRRYRAEVRHLHVEEKLMAYIASIVHSTRRSKDLFLGASPRASLAILGGAKAFAAMGGRGFVKPEDIQQVTPAVLRHRIILTPEKEMEGSTPDDIIKHIVKSIEVPR